MAESAATAAKDVLKSDIGILHTMQENISYCFLIFFTKKIGDKILFLD